MKSDRPTLFVAISVALLLVGPSPALALANRVFVSARSGSDANPCDSILAPCQTFAGAVGKLNPGGEAIVLDSGGYGPVTITKSLTIEAPPGVVAFIHPPSGAGVTVNAGGTDTVILRGLAINGSGTSAGIMLTSLGTTTLVESCTVSNFANGIEVDTGGNLLVKDSLFRANTQAGVDIVPLVVGSGVVYSTFDHCRFEDNAVFGLVVLDGTVTAVRDSVVSHNGVPGGDGLNARTQNPGGTATLSVTNTLVTRNGSGVFAYNLSGSGTPTIRIGSSTVVTSVGCGFTNSSGTFQSLGNNLVAGNGTDTCGTITTITGK